MLRRLSAAGFDVAAVGSAGEPTFEEAGIPFHRYELTRSLRPAADLGSLRSLRRLIARHRPAIVHGFDTKPALFTPFAAAGLRDVRTVRTLNGMGHLFSEETPATRRLRPVYRMAQRLVRPLTSHLVFQNGDDRRYFEERGLSPPGRSSLIHGSGIDERDFSHEPDAAAVARLREELGLGTGKTVVLVARLVRNKGVVEYLEAARAVRTERPGVRFLLVGPRESEGEQAVEAALLDTYREDVQVLGGRDDVPTILAAADLFVLPSYYREGVPRAVLEAAASGLPVVTTDMPGCRDVLAGGGVGRLVPPRDSAALAVAVRDVLDDASAWRERARAARPRVLEQFGLETISRLHIELYRSLLGAPGAA